jgi:hypothetical protein
MPAGETRRAFDFRPTMLDDRVETRPSPELLLRHELL